ncbi:hypothetical protein E0Z10_g3332 [Xylaria hypoxylon]|uniref:Rhodopsin domain-containing protein n=1 Tax=Xylaria hypoxylon TaxID=37992 RepID=A0A4Z0YNG9_9PEZI|nr:hypothetical protein E0Z10_g3332 [Xylaria hypoxylon]
MSSVPNRGPTLFAVCVTLLTVSVVTFSLRIYTRLFLVKAWGLDDWFMGVATIFFTLFVTSGIIGIHYGTGRHFADLEPEDAKLALKFWFLCYLWYSLTMIASKLSIAIFLLRLTISKTHHYIIYTISLFTIASGAVFFFVALFQCAPIPFFWDKDIVGGKCIDVGIIAALTYLYSSFSVVCDFTFAILPLFLIYDLQIDMRTKIALIPILSIGLVASIAVVVRFRYIETFKDPDFLWATIDIAIWSACEQGLSITAASLATLRPLFRNMGKQFGMWTPRTSMPLSGEAFPATIGSTDKFKERRAVPSRYGNISLATFVQKDDSEAAVNCSSDGKSVNQTEHSRKIHTTTTISVLSDRNIANNKRNTSWGLGRGCESGNESEEKLNA